MTASDMRTSGLMAGKKGLIMGVANEKSIAWGIAEALGKAGAELAFTYQTEAFSRRVAPLANTVGSDFLLPCDVANEDDLDQVFAALQKRWGKIDFVVHAIAYSDKNELKGRYVDTSRDNFRNTMDISCFSFTNVARRAAPLMTAGGSLMTLSYLGAARTLPNYNVMGVAKAALEASVKYLAADYGADNIRVNAISAGPMRTLAGSAIGGARYVYRYTERSAPLRRNLALEEVGRAGLYLASDLSSGVTGETMYVDAGFHAIAIPPAEESPPENGK